MKIKYKKYTGKPGFNDFVSMVWRELVMVQNDWKWGYHSNYAREVWKDEKYTGSPLPLVKEPKDFDPSSIATFILIYDQLKAKYQVMENKENGRFEKLLNDKVKKGEKQSEIIRGYINEIIGSHIPIDNKEYQNIYKALRQRIKRKRGTKK